MKYILLTLFLLVSFNFKAQTIDNEIKELAILESKQNITESDIDRILELCKNIYSLKPDLVLEHLDKLKPLIEEKKYYHAWDDYCFLILEIYNGKGQFAVSKSLINDIYNRYEDKFSQEDKVSVRLHLVLLAVNLNEYDESRALIDELLPIAVTPFQEASLYYSRAVNNIKSGDYKEALQDGLKALDLYKEAKEDKNISICYDQIAHIYQEMGNYEKALIYAKEGLKWAKQSNHYMSELSLYSNIGIYYRRLKQIDSTLHYYNLGLALAEKHNQQIEIARNLSNIGIVYSEDLRDYNRAETYYKQSLELCNRLGITYGIYINWLNLGNTYKNKKHYDNSRKAYDSASVYLAQLKTPSEEATLEESWYKLYKEQGNFQKALIHYERYNEIIQTLNLEEQKKQIGELQAKYDIAVKDKEIERINNENIQYRFRFRILFILVVVGVIGVSGLVYFMNYRNKALRNLYERNVEIAQTSIFPETLNPIELPEDNSPLRKVFDQLVDVMENEKLYKEPALTVDYVTQKIQTNKKYLSNSIAFYAKENFNNFVNSYRIKEARKIILQNPSLSLNEVMYECGFNSRTPFYTAFQKNTGMSPQQFKDLSMSKFKNRIEDEEDV